VPVFDVAGGDESGEAEGLAALRHLRDHDEPALLHAVGQGARGEGEEQDGRELERADQPELEGRGGELEDEP